MTSLATNGAVGSLLEKKDDERVIGPFYLEKQLGRGGFAPVWLAREVYDGKTLRTAAVKLFGIDASSGKSAEEAREHKDRIIEEARTLCRVEHPNVVRFYSLLIDEQKEVVGLAMEHVAGTGLDERLLRGPLSVKEALDLGITIGSALAAVHRAGLVHRDVKPGNVIEANGVYKLIDFGIAAAEEDAEKLRAAVRKSGVVKRVVLDDLPLEVSGTKMSMLASSYTLGGERVQGPLPVAVTGTIGYIDPASVSLGSSAAPRGDLYSLGAMLFECLTGKIPAAAGPAPGLSGEVLDGRAAPPPVRTIAPQVPEALAKVVDQLLVPDRDQRPDSADAVVERLRRAAIPRVPGAAERKRGPRVVLAMGVIIAASGTALYFAMKPPPPAPASGPAISESPACTMGDPLGCTRACDSGSTAACHDLALMYETGEGVPRDDARALALFGKACEGGVAKACGREGKLLEHDKRYAEALARYVKGCDADDAQSCTSAGVLLIAAKGASKDSARAMALFQRGCDAHYAGACASLGYAYELGEGAPRDLAKAAALYEQSCSGGAPIACANLGIMYATGNGVTEDDARAADFYRRACEGGYSSGCQGLGNLYETGKGVAKDPSRAAPLYEKACADHISSACANLGLLYADGRGVAQDLGRAAREYQAACDGDDPTGCHLLAGFYAEGREVTRDPEKARALDAKACAKDPSTCGEAEGGGPMPVVGEAPAPAPHPSAAPRAPMPQPVSTATPRPRPMPKGVLPPTPKPKAQCTPGDPLCGGF